MEWNSCCLTIGSWGLSVGLMLVFHCAPLALVCPCLQLFDLLNMLTLLLRQSVREITDVFFVLTNQCRRGDSVTKLQLLIELFKSKTSGDNLAAICTNNFAYTRLEVDLSY